MKGWLVLPHLAAEMMQLFLDAFAREHAPAGKRLVLVVDGASAAQVAALTNYHWWPAA